VTSGFDRNTSLEELEHADWGEPTFDSHLVITCHRLRRKSLIEFTVEDLRIMIGQGIGLPFLVPLAIERLETDPLAEGDLYAGDLLAAVLRVDKSFWREHADCFERMRRIVSRAKESLSSLEEVSRQTLSDLVEKPGGAYSD
jgi:CDI immunity proteins